MTVMDRLMGAKLKEIEDNLQAVNKKRLEDNQKQLLKVLEDYKRDIHEMTRKIIIEEFDKRIIEKIAEFEYSPEDDNGDQKC